MMINLSLYLCSLSRQHREELHTRMDKKERPIFIIKQLLLSLFKTKQSSKSDLYLFKKTNTVTNII